MVSFACSDRASPGVVCVHRYKCSSNNKNNNRSNNNCENNNNNNNNNNSHKRSGEGDDDDGNRNDGDDDDAWIEQRRFHVGSGFVTLGVSASDSDVITCCYSDGAHSDVNLFSLNGELLQSIGSGRVAPTADAAAAAAGARQQLVNPFLCASEVDGSVLIADCGDNSLKVMSASGRFQTLKMLPPELPDEPTGAALLNGHLYVTSWSQQVLVKYSAAW